MQPHHRLIVWKEAHRFVLLTYRATESFPKHELYGITSQLRRAAVSIATNLVEGSTRSSAKDRVRFIGISQGSSKECAYLLELSKDLTYLDDETYTKLETARSKTDYLLHQLAKSIVI